jgi:hypothetical protein
MENPKSQLQMLLEHLQNGLPITSLEAQTQYGIGRLASRIWDLQQPEHGSHKIIPESVQVVKANGKKATVTQYRYAKENFKETLFD